MSRVWLVFIALFILASDCSGNMYDLLPTKNECKQTGDKRNMSEIIRELKIAKILSFPDSLLYCSDGSWVAIGYNAKLIHIMAQKIGIKICKDFVSNVSDLDIGLKVSEWHVNSKHEFLYPHFKTDLCVVVQRKKPAYYSLMDILILSGTMNIILLVYLLLCALTLHILGLRAAALHVFKAFMTGAFPSDHQPPVRNSLYITVSMTGVIILSALSGIYTSKLAVQKDVRQIQTIEEAVNAVSELLLSEQYLHHVFDMKLDQKDVVSKLFTKMKPMFEDLDGFKAVAQNITKRTQIATVMTTHKAEYLSLTDLDLLDEDGRSLLHIIPEYIVSPLYYSFPVKKGCPLTGKFNEILMRLVDAGVVQHLYKETPYDWWKVGVLMRLQPPSKTSETSTEAKALILYEIHDQFVILIAALMLAVTIFIAELLIHNLNFSIIRSKLRN